MVFFIKLLHIANDTFWLVATLSGVTCYIKRQVLLLKWLF